MKSIKKVMAALSSAVLAVTVVGSTIPVIAASEELLNNSFEDGFGAWKGVGSSISISTDESHTGGSSLYVYDRTDTWGAPRCSIGDLAFAGHTYDFSAWAMFNDQDGNATFAMKIIYTDASGKDQYKDIKSASASKGNWVELKGSYTLPSDATNPIIYVEMMGASTDRCYYVDDITVSGEKITVEKESSYLNNFDDGTSQGWNGRGAATGTVTKGISHSGDYSMYVSGRTQLWNGLSANKSDILEAGKYYSLGCYVMYNEEKWADTQNFSINLQYDLNGKENYYTIATVKANKGEWTYVGSELTIPDGATNFSVYVQTGYVPTPAEQDLMNFYVDDCSGERLPDPAIQDDITALKDAYSDYFKLGCACAGSEFTQSATKDLILKHYNSLTLGNELKPDSVLDQAKTIAYMNANGGDQTNPQVSFKNADAMLKFAGENNIPVRGHVLVWHSQTPDWFFKENYDNNGAWVSAEVMTQRMENYIKNVMETLKTEYPDVEFYSWDVVNEAASDAGTIRPAGSNNEVNGQSAWVKVYGDQSYIEKAFTFARKYAPEGCKLFYNDYNEYSPNKRDYIISDILKPLVEKDLIDGMGMQSHISMSYPTIDLYKEAIQKYSDLGLEIQVTELDISQKSNTTTDQLELAQRYQDVFKMYKEMKDNGVDLSAVVLWGITDSTSWIGGYPLLFDKDYQAKPSYYAVVDTNSEVDKIQTMTSYYYDGTKEDLEHAFEIQNPQSLSSCGLTLPVEGYNWGIYFKSAWNEDGMVIRVYNTKLLADVSVYGSTDNQEGELLATVGKQDLNESYTDITVPLIGKPGNIVYLDVVAVGNSYNQAGSWNDVNFAYNKYLVDGVISKHTCGIVKLANQPKYTEAVKGTPEIDGEIDEIWNTAKSIDVSTYTMGSGATGTSKVLWDENYIYVLTEVKDSLLSKASKNAYEQDTVEVFFDENNNKTSYYESDDIQARVNFDNEKSVTDGLSTDNFISAAKKTSDGYIVEVALPFTISSFKANQIVGFDVQINDDNTGDGKRTGMANWNDLSGMGYTDTSGFGIMKLIGDNISYNDLIGDVNVDSKINLADVIYLNKYIAGSYMPSEQGIRNASCDQSNLEINLDDTLALLKYLLKIVALPLK
ncbi:MAG: endo-1,4-beta-xylanase [Ruminococcus sp.]|nr:endo-1,4-beta-xylanase [Ruminococcus sp.]